jgi:hypothetical protein
MALIFIITAMWPPHFKQNPLAYQTPHTSHQAQ